MDDDDTMDLAYEMSDIDGEHEKLDKPLITQRMTRDSNGYHETATFAGYPQYKLIVAMFAKVVLAVGEHPAAIVETPVGWRDMASEEAFLARFAAVVGTYAAHGWTVAE